jgi:UDP:flavonoid glycosyltransferase YjiC (YdhE family)
VNWSGAGIDLKTGTPTAEQIRDAVLLLLRDPVYRDRAKALGASIAKTNALTTIAEIVEATIAEDAVHKTGRPSMHAAQD